jgi:hypothetical protein
MAISGPKCLRVRASIPLPIRRVGVPGHKSTLRSILSERPGWDEVSEYCFGDRRLSKLDSAGTSLWIHAVFDSPGPSAKAGGIHWSFIVPGPP